MTPTRLPITLCFAPCPKCGVLVTFKMFESGAGGEFETYFGERTHSVYRLDLVKVNYLGKRREDLLLPAQDLEGGKSELKRIPNQLRCKVCGLEFNPPKSSIDGEETIDAVEL